MKRLNSKQTVEKLIKLGYSFDKTQWFELNVDGCTKFDISSDDEEYMNSVSTLKFYSGVVSCTL